MQVVWKGIKKRITEILGNLNSFLDSKYIASLRYDNSFAGCCNQAMHLFTEHRSIKTEKMNVNFIFAGVDGYALKTLYDFMYSTLRGGSGNLNNTYK